MYYKPNIGSSNRYRYRGYSGVFRPYKKSYSGVYANSKPRNRFTGFYKNGRFFYYKSSTLKNRGAFFKGRAVRSGNRLYSKKNVGQQGLVLQLPSDTKVLNISSKRKITKSRF